MNKEEVEFVDFGHPLHMDTKQHIIYNGREYNCIKGAVLHKKRSLNKKVKCYNFNYYWLENREKIIENIYKDILTVGNKELLKSLKFSNENFAYIDNGNRNLGIGYYHINPNTDEVSWVGKNIIGKIFDGLRKELL